MTRFPVIFADPPWAFSDKLTMSDVKRGAEANYAGTLSKRELCSLPVDDLSAADAVLVLWRPSALAGQALEVLNAWGFRQTQELVWHKVRESGKPHFGMGRILRASKEVAWVGVRGRPSRLLQIRNVRDVFVAPPFPHSAKPECVQDAFERMFAGPYLELFARRDRPGWTCVGNQTPSTEGQDVRDVLARMIARAVA